MKNTASLRTYSYNAVLKMIVTAANFLIRLSLLSGVPGVPVCSLYSVPSEHNLAHPTIYRREHSSHFLSIAGHPERFSLQTRSYQCQSSLRCGRHCCPALVTHRHHG